MTQQAATTKRTGSRFKLIGEIIAELRKAVWLSRREVMYLSALVLIISVVAGLILGAIDYGFAGLVEKFLLGK